MNERMSDGNFMAYENESLSTLSPHMLHGLYQEAKRARARELILEQALSDKQDDSIRLRSIQRALDAYGIHDPEGSHDPTSAARHSGDTEAG